LYRIADLSEVWVEGDVFEQDLQFVRVGSQAHIEVSAYPGHHLMGRVNFVYPTVDEGSRTTRVRVTVRNADMRLKPGMFATVFFDVTIGDDVLAVPLDAVIVTGERNIVFVHHDDGSYMPHEVVLGARTRDHVQILSGVLEGQAIVASANFLVDAESRLGSTGGSMAGMEGHDHD
jgi:Cu(I)/Ag(I) efflux system membrane fusion protein